MLLTLVSRVCFQFLQVRMIAGLIIYHLWESKVTYRGFVLSEMFPHQEEALGQSRVRWDKVFGLAWVCLDYRWMDGPPL